MKDRLVIKYGKRNLVFNDSNISDPEKWVCIGNDPNAGEIFVDSQFTLDDIYAYIVINVY